MSPARTGINEGCTITKAHQVDGSIRRIRQTTSADLPHLISNLRCHNLRCASCLISEKPNLLLTLRSTPYADLISCLMNTVYDTPKQIIVMAMRLIRCGMTT